MSRLTIFLSKISSIQRAIRSCDSYCRALLSTSARHSRTNALACIIPEEKKFNPLILNVTSNNQGFGSRWISVDLVCYVLKQLFFILILRLVLKTAYSDELT